MEEVKDVDFHAFSYYYDLAANVDLVGKGGWARNLGMDPWAEDLCHGAFCNVTMWLSGPGRHPSWLWEGSTHSTGHAHELMGFL